ncbi:MAG: sensor histidine kinase [Longibaculum sp.]
METNNREFAKIKRIFCLFLIGCFFIVAYINNIYLGYFLIILMSFGIFVYFYSLYKNLFVRIRQLIQYIDGNNQYIEDNDLGVIYDKVKRLKQENLNCQMQVKEEKKKLKKDIEDICHQMKTPLTSLSLYNEMLEKRYDYKYVQESAQQIEKMSCFLHGLLKLSQVEMIDFDFTNLPMDYVVDMAIDGLYAMIHEYHVKINHQRKKIFFYCDERWLQEALSNILKNAMEKGCHHLTISYEKHEQYFKIYIYNDGVEMDEEDISHIFERFYKTKDRSGQGVGIGLSLTKEIINKHHGQVIAYNQNGVVFELSFPLYLLSDKYLVTQM